MRDTISREELHRRFSEALAAQPTAAPANFAFEIDDKEPGEDGCNWYPLAAIQHWTGDIRANLATFRTVREELSRSYNLERAG